MKALIVKWQDTNKYVLHVKSEQSGMVRQKESRT